MSTHPKYTKQVFDQPYGPRPSIEGVEMIALPLQSDDGGNFAEIVRMAKGDIIGQKTAFEAKQMSISILTPGTIKAFHLHTNQDDLWYTLPTERLVVNLHDVRKDSATFDVHMRLVLGAGKNLLLRIPKGVAHGVANLYERNMMLLYITNQHFDLKNPDEHRLPWDIFGKDIWEVAKG